MTKLEVRMQLLQILLAAASAGQSQWTAELVVEAAKTLEDYIYETDPLKVSGAIFQKGN